jgi:hypothetical protein
MAQDVPANREFFEKALDFQLREQKIGDGGAEVGACLSVRAGARSRTHARFDRRARTLSSRRVLVWRASASQTFSPSAMCGSSPVLPSTAQPRHISCIALNREEIASSFSAILAISFSIHVEDGRVECSE